MDYNLHDITHVKLYLFGQQIVHIKEIFAFQFKLSCYKILIGKKF